MLRWRLIGAAAIIFPVLLVLWCDHTWNFGAPGIWLIPLGWAAIVVSIGELHALQKGAGRQRGTSTLAVACGSIVFLFATVPTLISPLEQRLDGNWGWLAVGMILAIMFRMSWAMTQLERSHDLAPDVAFDLFHAFYVVLPICFLFELRQVWLDERGLWAMASIPWIVKVMDSGAYFTGRTWGRRPLAPRLSPKKTWEGAAGGFLAGVIAAVLFFSVAPLVMNAPFHPRATIVLAIGYGIVLSLAGILGDLAESLLKRDADRKDSSNWLPGLGGTLDVLDSLFWAAPAAYVYWMLVMPPS